jgi:nitric oxide reductase subunit C
MPATEAPAGPTATEPFVALWIISGTPTPTPGGAVASAPTTAVTAAPGGAVATSTRRPTNTPAGGAAASGPGNPGRGQQIFTGIAGCNACHDVQAGVQIVGPTLKGIASRAAQRQPGVAADVYLRESILNPNKYLVPGFAQGLMPQTFSNTLSAGQINDLIAYLMTLG